MAAAALQLKLQARAAAAVPASNNVPTWLVGTTSLRSGNEVHVVEHDSESETLRVTASYAHPAGEVWCIDTSPTDPELFGTVSSQGGKTGAALWRAHPLAGKATLSCDLGPKHSSHIRQLQWNAQDSSQLLTVESARVQTWQVREAAAEVSGAALMSKSQELGCAAWDASGLMRLASAEGGQIQVWDLRQRAKQRVIHSAHALPIRCLAFTNQRPDCLLSCGDDGRIRVWDLRVGAASAPLLDITAHDHWVWRIAVHPTYDNLLLSCSSDNTCSLWHLNLAAATHTLTSAACPAKAAPAAGASKPSPGAAAGGKAGGLPTLSPAAVSLTATAGGSPGSKQLSSWGVPSTGRLQHCRDHVDSVYQVAWSPTDPWSYVSLSFDGRLILNQVPSQTKYKLLL